MQGRDREDALTRVRALAQELLARMEADDEDLPTSELDAVMLEIPHPGPQG